MDTQDDMDKDKAIRILGLDSGGAGSYSQLMLVRELMRKIATEYGSNEDDVYPADHFEMIGGVGFGGIAALMLGHIGMTVDEAENSLLGIASAIFPYDENMRKSPETNMQNLRVAIEAMLKAKGIPLETKMHDTTLPSTKCKVAIYAATSADVMLPYVFRTYVSRTKTRLNPTIVDALCATMAIPSLFSPVKIGRHMREQEFIGGPLGANNPTRELLKEATLVFGANTRVAQIVSLGAGQPRSLSFESLSSEEVASQSLKSLVTDCESVAAELSTWLFSIDAYVRLNVPSEMGGASIDNWNDLASIESCASAYMETKSMHRTMEQSVQYMQSRVGTATLGQINQSSSAAIMAKMAPAVSPHYVIRQKEWNTATHHLVNLPSNTQKTFCITGMGGCGKTQLVSYFLQERGSQYNHTVFVDASSAASLKSSLQAWSQSLGNGHEEDVWENAIQNLASDAYRQWILVLDNADDPRLDLMPFLPKCHHGTVIITSRNRDVGDLSNTHHLEMGEMTPDEALSTLLKAARRQLPLSSEEVESAKKLIKRLGYLAVAVVQAGVYCHQLSTLAHKQFTFSQYSTLFNIQHSKLMKTAEPLSLDNYQLGAYTAFDMSYRAMPQYARDFLHFTSSLYHSYISLKLFSTAAQHSFTDPNAILARPAGHEDVVGSLKALLCANGTWSEIQVHEAIHTLRSFSLIEASSLMNMVFLHMHPLVHSWARDILPSKAQLYRRMATQILTSSVRDNRDLYQHILPHIQGLIDATGADEAHVNDQYAAGVVLKRCGYYPDAETLFGRILKRITGKGSEHTGDVIDWIASTLHAAGKWSEAENLRRMLLAKSLEHTGNEGLNTTQLKANLAATLSSQGQLDEAEKLKLEVLHQRTIRFGPQHEDTMLAKANLSVTYTAQGRHSAAEKLDLEVLEYRKKVLGDDHPDTLDAMMNLAVTYSHQGRYAEAERLKFQALEKRKRVLGKGHPDSLRAASALAATYGHQRRFKEAAEIEIEVLEQLRGSLGNDHPDTILAMSNLALTYSDLKEWKKAKDLLTEALPISRRVLGPKHASTENCIRGLVTVLTNMGKLREAAQLFRLLPNGQ